jgi:hypothetical protein
MIQTLIVVAVFPTGLLTAAERRVARLVADEGRAVDSIEVRPNRPSAGRRLAQYRLAGARW